MQKAWILIAFVGLGLIWGGAFVAIKVLVTALPPMTAVALRLTIAVPFLWVVFVLMKRPMRVPKNLVTKSAIAGLFMIGIPYCFVAWGETKVPAGLAGIINGSVPIFTTLLTVMSISPWYDHRQKLSKTLIFGLLLGFAGLITISLPRLDWDAPASFWGAMACVVMALCYSLSNVLNARLLTNSNKVTITANTFLQHWTSWIFVVCVALVSGEKFEWSTVFVPPVFGSLLFLGCLSGATALLIYYALIREIGAVKTSAITYLIPVAAVVLDLILLNTKLDLSSLVGAGLILTGILFIRTNARAPVQQVNE